jgi:hypothetical protein
MRHHSVDVRFPALQVDEVVARLRAHGRRLRLVRKKIDALVTRRPGTVPGTAVVVGGLAYLVDVNPVLDIALWAIATLLMGACAFLDQDALNYHGSGVFREGPQELSDWGRFAQRSSFALLALVTAALGIGETLGKL